MGGLRVLEVPPLAPEEISQPKSRVSLTLVLVFSAIFHLPPFHAFCQAPEVLLVRCIMNKHN